MRVTAIITRTLAVFLASVSAQAQDTFSIVAVDSVTGEVGSAGASCLGSSTIAPKGAFIIFEVFPGRGAINTQAQWDPDNQNNARVHFKAGESPQQVIDWLTANDANNSPDVRQYGIVDLNGGHPRSAGYTGSNCFNYKNHISGPGYCIQGNILLGQNILDSMEYRFLNTPGTLAERLMSALQAANVVGADTRCAAPYESSSLSSFIRVARPDDDDTIDHKYLELYMSYPQTFSGKVPVDPIDSLQTMFNKWKLTASVSKVKSSLPPLVKLNYTADVKVVFDASAVPDYLQLRVAFYDKLGREISMQNFTEMRFFPRVDDIISGIYFFRVLNAENELLTAGQLYIPGN